MNIYQTPDRISKSEFVRTMAMGTADARKDALVGAVHSIDDYDWLVEQIALALHDEDADTRGVAVLCVGHLARLFDSACKEQLLKLIEPFPLGAKGPMLGRVEDAIDDINHFCKLRNEGII